MSASALDEESSTSQDQQEKPVRKRRRVYGIKVCQVCGDKALAHHFGALACETCKAFFRRNALCKEQKKCLFKAECPIDVKTRRFCPACRLAKCFSVGMRADLILDDEEKKQRIQKMAEKKCKKEASKLSPEYGKDTGSSRQSPTCVVTTTGEEAAFSPDQTSSVVEQAWLSASAENGAADLQVVRSSASLTLDSRWGQEGIPFGPGQNVEAVLSNSEGLVMDQESKLTVVHSRESIIQQPSAECPYPSAPATPVYNSQYASPARQQSLVPTFDPVRSQPYIQDSTSGPSTALVAQPLFSTAFKHVSREELPSDPYMYWRLSDEERSLLTQLSAAYQDTVLSLLKGSPPREDISSQMCTHEMCLEEWEDEAGCAVSFAKRMEDFRQLRLDEQIALLKASTCQVLGIRSCALYIAEKDAWLTSKGYFTFDHCKRLFPNHPHADAGLDFCRTIKSIVKNDVTLYALLHCVVLFDPSDERIIDRQLINSIRDKYIILLRHYLESVYSYAHSDKYMMALLEKLIAYRSLCLEGKPLIRKFFPSIPNKLLIEVLDLE